MKLPIFAGNSLAEFVKSAGAVETHEAGRLRWKEYGVEVERPSGCPQRNCGSDRKLRRNGSYPRQVFEGLLFAMLMIYRFRCGLCGKTVSCPYSFLVPYRRFTAMLICRGVEQYGGEQETSYRDVSADLSVFEQGADGEAGRPVKSEPVVEDAIGGKDGFCPARSTVFGWVDFVCKRIARTVQQIEKELVLRNVDLAGLAAESQYENKNARKAGAKRYRHQQRKPEELNKLTYGLAAARSLVGEDWGAMGRLRAYFLQSAERCADLLSDVSMVLPITQTSEHPLW